MAVETIITIHTQQGYSYDFAVTRSPFLVGRGAHCDMHLPSPTVSHEHLRLEIDSGANHAILTDLGSSNGSHAGEHQLAAHRPLAVGMPTPLRVGDVRMELRRQTYEEESQSLEMERSWSLSRLILNSLVNREMAQKRARIEALSGARVGEYFAIPEDADEIRIGLGTDVDWGVPEPALDTPIHILSSGPTYLLQPHSSRAVMFRRRRVKQAVRLRDGDEIWAGPTVLRFRDPLQDLVDEISRGKEAAVPASPQPRPKRPWSVAEIALFGFAIAVMLMSILAILVILGVIPWFG